MAEKRDYYEVLGVDKNADADAIKRAFRQQAKKNHPDLNPGDKDAEERFKEINEAYQVLSDPQKRAQYDQFGFDGPQAGPAGGGFGGFGFGGGGFGGGFDDIFSSFFGGGAGSSRRGPVPGDDIRVDLTIDFAEAVKGCEKEISYARDEECPECKGTGAKPGTTPQTCPQCHGTGQQTVMQQTMLGRIQTTTTCSRCRGSGKIISDPCTKCRGRGKFRSVKRRSVKIPAGVDTGIVLTLRGEGAAGERGGEPGDLQIVMNVRPHKLFKRQDYDLFIDVPLSFTQAALGTEMDVPTIDKPVKYTFPEGTQPGQRFCIRGKGVPYLRGSGKGDLYVTVDIEVPKRLNEKQKSILREFDQAMAGSGYDKKKSFLDRVKDAFN